MKLIGNAIKGVFVGACLLVGATAVAHEYHDVSAIGACEPYTPADATLLSHTTTGEIQNSTTEDVWVHCGFGTADLAQNGQISAYVYGTTSGYQTIDCTLVGTRASAGTKVTSTASTSINGSFRVMLPWLSIAPDINNFIVASAYCKLPPGSKIRAARLFDFTP